MRPAESRLVLTDYYYTGTWPINRESPMVALTSMAIGMATGALGFKIRTNVTECRVLLCEADVSAVCRSRLEIWDR